VISQQKCAFLLQDKNVGAIRIKQNNLAKVSMVSTKIGHVPLFNGGFLEIKTTFPLRLYFKEN